MFVKHANYGGGGTGCCEYKQAIRSIAEIEQQWTVPLYMKSTNIYIKRHSSRGDITTTFGAARTKSTEKVDESVFQFLRGNFICSSLQNNKKNKKL